LLNFVNYGINNFIQYKALQIFSFVNSRFYYFKLCSVLLLDVFHTLYYMYIVEIRCKVMKGTGYFLSL